MNTIEQLRRYAELRARKSDLEAQLKDVNGEIDSLVRDTATAMIDAGLTSMRLDGVGSFTVTEELYPSVKDQSALYAYLRETGQESVIKESVHFQTLRAMNNLNNEQSGCDLPGVESFRKLQIKMRKS